MLEGMIKKFDEKFDALMEKLDRIEEKLDKIKKE